MLRTSLRDKTQPRTEDEPELVDGATEVIEAATAEAAIAEVHERLGPDARILEAQRDLRGGIAGFFAKEVVRLHAAPAELGGGASEDATAFGPMPGLSGGGDVSVASPVERLLEDAPDTVDFATFLRERMASDPGLRIGATDGEAEVAPDDQRIDTGPSIGTASVADADPSLIEDPAVAAWREAARRPLAPPAEPGTSAPSEPASVTRVEVTTPPPPTADTIPGPAWSCERLLHLGVPAGLVRSLDLDQDADDLTWTMALAREIAEACGPLPGGPALLVGPLADDLKGEVDEPTARSQVWFDALRDGRWLHLVVGGEGWRDHLSSGPRVVSWSRPQDLPDALRCALELGLTIGYGPLGGQIRRARPLDVALGIRTLVDG